MADSSVRPQTEHRQRLVLGFDASCTACTELATIARTGSGRRLEVLALDSIEMAGWLATAGGPGSRRRPVLVRLEADEERAPRVHAGRVALPIALIRHVGLRRALAIAAGIHRYYRDLTRHREGSAREYIDSRPTRRVVLGGALAAVVTALLPGRAAAAAAGGPAIAPSATAIAAWRRSPAVRMAVPVFGAPDWARAQPAATPVRDARRFVVPLAHEQHGTSWVVAGADDREAVVLRLAGAGPGTFSSSRFELYDVDGTPAVTVAALDGLLVVPLDAPLPPDVFRPNVSAVPTIPSKAFFICFNNCLQANGLQDYAGDCHACLSAPTDPNSWLSCAKCTAAVGDYFGVCVRACRGL